MRGSYERPIGSGVYWIHYYVEGKRRREKVGRRSDAIALYQLRKTDARRGIKMPEVRPGIPVLLRKLPPTLWLTPRNTSCPMPAIARP